MDYKYDSIQDIINKNMNQLTDIKNEYYNLINQQITDEITDDKFFYKVDEISQIGTIYVCYYLDNELIKFAGSGVVILEPKIINAMKYVARIEDIIVCSDHLNNADQIRKTIMSHLTELANNKNCFEIIIKN